MCSVFGMKCLLSSNLTAHLEPFYNLHDYLCEIKYRIQITQKDARNYLLKCNVYIIEN